MWDLIDSVPDHCLSFYFFIIWSLKAIPSDFNGETPLLSHLSALMNKYSFLGFLSLDTVSLP